MSQRTIRKKLIKHEYMVESLEFRLKNDGGARGGQNVRLRG